MKKNIAFGMSIFFLLVSACQPKGENVQVTATQAPVRVEAATSTLMPSPTLSPEPTITSTPVPLTYPLGAGTAVPADLSNSKIMPDTAISLKEIIRIKQDDVVFFDAKHWEGTWLVDTNQGVKLLNEKGEWLADLGASQRLCPKSNRAHTGDPSNIFIGPGGIGVVGLDGVHVYSLDGQTQTAFVPLDEQYIAMGWGCMYPSFLAVVSPDMKWVAASKPGISYNTTEIISTESGKNVVSLPGDAVRMFSPDSQYLLFESGENRFFLYKTSDWSRALLLRSEDFIFTFGFSPSGEYMFYQRTSGWVIFHPSDANTTLVNKQAYSLMFNRNTNEIGMVYWNDANNLHVLDFDSGNEIRMDKMSADGWMHPVMDLPSTLSFQMKNYSERGTYNTVCDFEGDTFSCYAGPTVCTFDLNGRQDCAPVKTQTSIKKTMEWGEYILYEKDGSYSGLLPPWEMAADMGGMGSTWAMTLAEDKSPGDQWSMMSPDQSHFMYTTVDSGNQINITIHFVTNDMEVAKIKLQRLLNAVISPDSKYMLAAVDTYGEQVWLLDLETGNVIKEFSDVGSGASARGLAFSSDNRFAAYVDIKFINPGPHPLMVGKLLIYDLVEGKQKLSIDLDLKKGNVNVLAFSLDSSLIAVGTFDGKVSIYDAVSSALVNSWYAHVGVVSDLNFSPDGKWLLSAGGMDENIKLWTVVQE